MEEVHFIKFIYHAGEGSAVDDGRCGCFVRAELLRFVVHNNGLSTRFMVSELKPWYLLRNTENSARNLTPISCTKSRDLLPVNRDDFDQNPSFATDKSR